VRTDNNLTIKAGNDAGKKSWEFNRGADRNKKIEPGHFAEGPRSPGLSCPPPQGASKKPDTAENFQAWDSQQLGDNLCLPNFLLCRRKLRSDAAFSGKMLKAKLLGAFFTAQKFVALNSSHYAYGALTWLGTLHASKTAHTHWTCQGDFIWKRQEYFNSRTFFHIFLKEEIHPAGADIAGFCTCFTNGRTCGPTNGERKAHGKALGSAAF